MPSTVNFRIDEPEAKIMLLWLHSVSETTWTDEPTAQRMREFAARIERTIIIRMPHLKDFLKDKDAEIGNFK